MQLRTTQSMGELIRMIEKSGVPLGEEEGQFHAIREKHARKEPLTASEHNLILKLVKKAEEWEKAVEASAGTEPEDTLSG